MQSIDNNVLLWTITDYLDIHSYVNLLKACKSLRAKLFKTEMYFRALVHTHSNITPDENDAFLNSYEKIHFAFTQLIEDILVARKRDKLKSTVISNFVNNSKYRAKLILSSQNIWRLAVQICYVSDLFQLLFEHPEFLDDVFANNQILSELKNTIYPLDHGLFKILKQNPYMMDRILVHDGVLDVFCVLIQNNNTHIFNFTEIFEHIPIADPKVVNQLNHSHDDQEKFALWKSLQITAKIKANPRLLLLYEGLYRNDLRYFQKKPFGKLIFLIAQTIVTRTSHDVEMAVLLAEHQHRKNLMLMKEDCNYKTVITITQPDNTWPFQSLPALKAFLPREKKFRSQCEFRIRRIVFGEHYPEISDPEHIADDRIFQKLLFVEAINIKPIRPAKSPLKAMMARQNKHQRLPIIDTIIREVSEYSTEERIARKILVTESIKIINPTHGFIVVLTRTEGGDFVAHIKSHGEKRTVKRQRWDDKIIPNTFFQNPKSTINSENDENSNQRLVADNRYWK